MLQILVSFLYMLFITLGLGAVFVKWIDLQRCGLVLTLLMGLFSQVLLATFYALFFPIDGYFYIINSILSASLIIWQYSLVKNLCYQLWARYLKFSVGSKLFFLGIVLLSLLHSSSLPFLTDNESYYIQTVKWLNNYGFVKGIFNLHLFFGQFSGWHILQSTFNFGFATASLNDINGFLIVIVSFFSIDKWEVYKLQWNRNDLFISLLNGALLFLFLFIASPSPDFPILVIVPLIFYLFLEFKRNPDVAGDHIKIISILSLLIVLIKVTIFPILIVLFLGLIQMKSMRNWGIVALLSFIALLSFVLKNIVVSGYPLYPLPTGVEWVDVDWKINRNLEDLYNRLTRMSGWKMYDWESFRSLNFFEKFWVWLNLPKVHGIVNKMIVLAVALFPFFVRKQKELRVLSSYIVVHFLIFYLTSPQYRYFIAILLVMIMFVGVKLLHKKKRLIEILFAINGSFLLIVGLFGLHFNGITDSNIMKEKYSFVSSQLIEPRAATQFSTIKFKEYAIGNLNYFSPEVDSLYFYQTFDGPLPCVNKDMVDYFSKYYNHIPQMRTKDLKDGFKSGAPE